MPRPFFNIDPLISSIEAGHLILTPNFRLARHITQAWGQRCVEHGLLTWRQPLVLAIEGWLTSCWAELIEDSDLLTYCHSVIDSHAEQLLWRSSIAQDEQLPSGADIPSLAELAMQTWQQLQRCRVPLHELSDSHHPGGESFLRWLDTFSHALAQKHLLTWEQAQGLIEKAFKDGAFSGYKAINLAGFQTLPALHRDIIDAATKDVHHCEINAAPANATLQACLDQKNEITAAAQWAKALHEANPEQRIGIVFGNLATTQQQVSRIFHDTFQPEHGLPDCERSIASFNFSAGSPLGHTPLLESALGLLAVQEEALPLEGWCHLLADPFWGLSSPAESENTEQSSAIAANKQLIARAHCELLLRDSNKLAHTPSAFRASLAEAERQAASTPPESENPAALPTPDNEYLSLAPAWQSIAERVRRQPKTAPFCDWAEEFSQRLDILGWPGSRTLDSIEYQQHQHWLSLLEAFASLDTSAEPLSAVAALTQLTRMAQAMVFQAQSHDSQIQILGLLEAAGLEFDQLWIAGMDDRQWPQPTSLNPLLPVDLQQRYQLPRSSASQELTLAKQLLHDFQHSSQNLVFSYATQDGDTELEASRLLPEALIVPAMAANPTSSNAHHPLLAALPNVALQQVDVSKGPPLQPGDKSVRGGTAILQAQAGSPFNAFATWRLGARPLAEPSSGLSAIERGNLVHSCLELFWTRFHNQASVKALDSAALDLAVEEVIAKALRPLHQSRSDIFGPRFAAIEAQRLKHLLQQWLDIELQRQAFSILAPEKQLFMSIGGLPLSLRIDRIDRLDDQRIVLIDYKTGDTNINCWAGERLEEPQLPLYALALPEQIGALCFGQISTVKSVTAKGVSDTPEIIPGLQPLTKIDFEGWEDCLEVWREQLETLAKEFLDGQAEIVFYTSAALRYQSHLYPLNRWPEIAQRSNTADETADNLN
ncbi:MAG: PD-(D/E)XK nuclease family protein [Candidatus Reddybacter sp.]